MSIAAIEELKPGYFTLANLKKEFGNEEGRLIHRNVYDVKNPKTAKGQFNAFAKKSREQPCSLEMLVIQDKERAAKEGLPLIQFNKKGKQAEHLTKKIAKYITEKLPFIEVKSIGEMDAFFPIASYLNDKKGLHKDKDKTIKSYFKYIPKTEFKNFLEKYTAWESERKAFIRMKERVTYMKNNPVRDKKSGNKKKGYDAEVGKNKNDLRELNKQEAYARKEVLLAYQGIKPLIERSIAEKTKDENEYLMLNMFLALGNIKDMRGELHILDRVPDNYREKIEDLANYITGSFENHGDKSKKERSTDYEGLHAQMFASRFENDTARHKKYALAEQLELQVNSVNNFVKSLFGKFNHTEYHDIREKQTFEHFSEVQKSFYQSIIDRLNTINASHGDDIVTLELAFGRLYDTKTSARKSDAEYESLLDEESKMLNDKWNDAT